jgi:hypothetical protein
VADNDVINPLSDLISDEMYQALEDQDLLSEKGIRDFRIRQKFRRMRDREIPAADAIELLREEYPYLQFDTIRKIVYRLGRRRRTAA